MPQLMAWLLNAIGIRSCTGIVGGLVLGGGNVAILTAVGWDCSFQCLRPAKILLYWIWRFAATRFMRSTGYRRRSHYLHHPWRWNIGYFVGKSALRMSD